MERLTIDGGFMKQFVKACGNRHQGLLAQPWHSGGKLYATDAVRCYRLTLKEELVKPDWPDFAISAEACANGKPKKAFEPFPDHVHTEWGRFESVQPEGKFPKVDKLFEIPDVRPEFVRLDPGLVQDVAALAKTVKGGLRVRFSKENGPVLFEFNTPWGLCECLVMTQRF